MQIQLLVVGDTADKNIQKLIENYCGRIKHYAKFKVNTISTNRKVKQLNTMALKKLEGELIARHIKPSTYLILLDEKGESFSSEGFSAFLQKRLNSGIKEVVFCIGGAYGFDQQLYNRANASVSLSEMTFTHQMVRLVFVEQLYRAFTILKGEQYHH